MARVLEATSAALRGKEIDAPRLNAERLLSHVLGMPRFELYLNHDRPLTEDERNHLRELVRRRMGHEPLQYILGETEFFSLPIKLMPDVLIPRPETEVLVEKVIQWCRDRLEGDAGFEILDVGTGSGNIAIALAVHLKQARVAGLDISEPALAVARENAELNHVADRIEFRAADVLKTESRAFGGARFSVVVSNPPYVAPDDISTLAPEVKEHEPRAALTVSEGEDELLFFRRITKLSRALLITPGLLAFEVGLGQDRGVQRILLESGFMHVHAHLDLAKRKRVITGELV